MSGRKQKREIRSTRQSRSRKARAPVRRRRRESERQVEYSTVAMRPDSNNPKQLTEEGQGFEAEVISGVEDTRELDDAESDAGNS
jgi:hypothetical protein